MRYSTWGYHKEKMRTRLGCSTYCMRCWLRLLQCSQSLSSYPLSMSMLSLGGIDRNRDQLINSFPDRFSFHSYSSNVKNHIKNLDDIIFRVLSNPSSSIVVSDASIKNHVAMSILHIHLHNKPIIKMIYRVVNITTTEAELFTIQCSINQVVGITNINYIIIITNSLYAAKKIFDSSSHSYQIHSTAISQELRGFFTKNINNCIKF